MNPVTYTMLDLKGLDLASVKGQSYPGLYNSIYAAMNRCQEIILCNWFVAGIVIPPTYCHLVIGLSGTISINDMIFIHTDDTVEIPLMGTTPRILALEVTGNGEYVVPVDYDGFNPVNVDVQPPLEEITITENGEYLPSEGYYGIGKVIASITSGIPLLTNAEWDALSAAQKQAYGLVAIQRANSGFNRGALVYGADYISTLLTASAPANILAEALCENFVPSTSWGGLTLVGASSIGIKEDGSINFNGDTMSAFYDLGEANTKVTNYMVFKSLSSSNISRLISNVYANSSGNAPGMYRNGQNIYYTYYGGDTNTGVSAIDGFHCIACTHDRNPNTSTYYVDGVKKGTNSPSNVGRYTEFSATLQMGGNKYGGNYDIKYMAVVAGAESEATVIANMQNIMAHYGIT